MEEVAGVAAAVVVVVVVAAAARHLELRAWLASPGSPGAAAAP